jgi:lysophospholipase
LQEERLERDFTNILAPFFRDHFEEFTFKGVRNQELRGLRPRQEDLVDALLVLGGRTEFAEKYAELFFDLQPLHMAIYSYDHRGQGLSQRPLTDPHKGHVEDFGEYIEDLRIFLNEVIGRKHRRVFVLAHSMGGAVTALFLQKYQGYFAGAILCSPMFAINCHPLPCRLMGWLADLAVLTGRGAHYVPRGGPYPGPPPFLNNVLTSSRVRFDASYSFVEKNPTLALGSPTFLWLREALRSSKKAVAGADRVDIPVLLLQAGGDEVVTSSAQLEFCRKAPQCRLHTIAGARHELLMEQDLMRDEAIHLIHEFLLKE